MRTITILALALLIGTTPLSAQGTGTNSEPQSLAAEANSPADIAVDLLAGTLGIGIQISKLVVPHVGIRAGASRFTLNKTITQSDVEFDASLKLASFTALVDFFPSSRGVFRFTGGLLSNRTIVDAIGTCSGGEYKINGRSYTCAQVGTLTGSVKFPSASPYAGLGFGTPARGSRVHFVMDLGAAFGTPTLSLSSSNSGSNPQLAADVQAERDKDQKDVEKYAKIYPVIQLGLGIRF